MKPEGRRELHPKLVATLVAALCALAVLAAVAVPLADLAASARAQSRVASAKPPAAATAPAPSAPRARTKAAAATETQPADPYRGLGAWVDIYDDKAWADPAKAVAIMHSKGVRTLFIETANSSQPYAIMVPAKMRIFIRAAHAHKMNVVGWYLPELTALGRDYSRSAYAIRFHTADGQTFDSFALDIESGAVSDITPRNAALRSLSARLRKFAGPWYRLGAITPAPAAILKPNSNWPRFPFTMLAGYFDYFLPMSYYTFHGRGYSAAYADTTADMRVLRAQKGCEWMPVHLIGGLTEQSTAAEAAGFIKAAKTTGAIGASLYEYSGTTLAQWRQLKYAPR
jgi:hypothetical protein